VSIERRGGSKKKKDRRALFAHELTTLRTCVNRQQPFGAEDWQVVTAPTFGLESTLRRRGTAEPS